MQSKSTWFQLEDQLWRAKYGGNIDYRWKATLDTDLAMRNLTANELATLFLALEARDMGAVNQLLDMSTGGSK